MIWFSWSGPRQKTNYVLLLLTSTTFTPPSNSHHPIQQHLLLFSTSQVSPSQLGKVETNLCTKPTDKIRNEPFHSVSLSDYDACGLQTKASHYAPVNSSNTLTIVDTTSLFSKKEIQRVHAITRNKTHKPSQTTTNQPSRVPLVITYHPALRSISSIILGYINILSSFPRCNNVFQTTYRVAFRRTDNLTF